MQEEWKEVWIDGCFCGKLVSNLGRLKKADGTLMKLYDNGAGYLSGIVGSIKGKTSGKYRNRLAYIHRLVAMYFLPNPFSLPQVNHKDCDKSNNCVSNLEWISRKANIGHAHASGRMKKRTENGKIVVLTPEQVRECYTRVKLGEGINVVAKSMGKARTTISSIMNKRSRSDITDKIDAEFLELAEMKYLEEV